MMTQDIGTDLVRWFEEQHGTLDTSSMGIVDFPGHGRGAIALKDIPVRHSIAQSHSGHRVYSLVFAGRSHNLQLTTRVDFVYADVNATCAHGQRLGGASAARRLGWPHALYDVGGI